MKAAPEPNWTDQTIWTGDNLDIMRSMNSATVDLAKIVGRVRISCLLKEFEIKTGRHLGAVAREGIAHAATEAIGHIADKEQIGASEPHPLDPKKMHCKQQDELEKTSKSVYRHKNFCKMEI